MITTRRLKKSLSIFSPDRPGMNFNAAPLTCADPPHDHMLVNPSQLFNPPCRNSSALTAEMMVAEETTEFPETETFCTVNKGK